MNEVFVLKNAMIGSYKLKYFEELIELSRKGEWLSCRARLNHFSRKYA